jgi:hypothetical protein
MYCTKCGTQNEDDSVFCKQCGSDLKAGTGGPAPTDHKPRKSKQDEECEKDCKGSDKEQAWFWGIIVVLVGAWVIWEFGLKNVVDVPEEIGDFEFCWLIWIIVGIAIIAAGFRMIMRRTKQG